MTDPALEAEISAAKARLGYGPTEPAPGLLVAGELPAALRRPFWERQIDRYFDQEAIADGRTRHVCPDDCKALTGQAWHDLHSFEGPR